MDGYLRWFNKAFVFMASFIVSHWRSDKKLSSSVRVVMDNWHGYEPLHMDPDGRTLSEPIMSVIERVLGFRHNCSNILGFPWLFIWITWSAFPLQSASFTFFQLKIVGRGLLDTFLCISLLSTPFFFALISKNCHYSW